MTQSDRGAQIMAARYSTCPPLAACFLRLTAPGLFIQEQHDIPAFWGFVAIGILAVVVVFIWHVTKKDIK